MNEDGTPEGRHAATAGSLTVADLLARVGGPERQPGVPSRTAVQLMPVSQPRHRSTAAPVREPEGRAATPGHAGPPPRLVDAVPRSAQRL